MAKSKRMDALAGHYVDQLANWTRISTRPLFGACGLYRQGQVFGLVWQGAPYLKADRAYHIALKSGKQ